MIGRFNPFENKRLNENIIFILYSLLVLSFPFSKAFVSIFSGLIFLTSLFFSISRNGFVNKFKADYTWFGMLVIYGIYLIGFIFTNDIKTGIYELNKELNWLLLSLGIFLTPRFSEKKFILILFLFVFGVTIATFFSFFKMYFAPAIGIENFREVNFISHIPFSFQVAFSIFILCFYFFYENQIFGIVNKTLRIIWILWLLIFLIVLKSMLGIVSFYFTSIFLAIFILRNLVSKKTKRWLIAGVFLCYIAPLVYIGNIVYEFYDLKDPKIESAERFTKQGNEYYFDLSSKVKEKGHYVYWFICDKELREVWKLRSKYDFDGYDDKGFLISHTLFRYMTSKGLRKDAEGFFQLSNRDIHNIEMGMGSYVYNAPAYAFYPRIYETVWEIDNYLITGDPNDKSLSQRIEYTKAAFQIIKNNFWFGIGTGNFKVAYHSAYSEIGSKLKEENYGMTHNQYLSYWIKFGIIGLIVIFFIIFYISRKRNLFKNGLFILFFIFQLVANMGDTNWETHMGLAFFIFFFSLFLWHSELEMS